MGSVILNFRTRGVQLCRWLSLLGFYDVQRTKAGVVAVSLGVEQIVSASTILLPLLTFCF